MNQRGLPAPGRPGMVTRPGQDVKRPTPLSATTKGANMVCKYCDRRLTKKQGSPEFLAVPNYKGEGGLNRCSKASYHRHYHWPKQ